MEYSAIHLSGETVEHYGVLGMKWGVRKDPSRAYTKAVKKKNRLESRSSYYNLRSARLRDKALRKEVRARNETQYRRARKIEYKANRNAILAARYQRKGQRWVRAMEKTFAGYDIRSLSKDEITRGRKYLYEVTKRKSD